jgi:hypothetical protein
MKSISSESNVFLLSYENLKSDTRLEMLRILKFLNLEVNNQLLDHAIEASSIKSFREQGKKSGAAIHTPKNYNGSFARYGKVGQYSDFFDKEAMTKVEMILNKDNSSLIEFDIEI